MTWSSCSLYFSVCVLQGDRGYEGPKGSRGIPGLGYKGEKVRLTNTGLETNIYCKNSV